MIRIALTHGRKGKFFDTNYYLDNHLPFAIKLFRLHVGFLSLNIERPYDQPSWEITDFIFKCSILFNNIDNAMYALTEVYPQLQDDMRNFTDEYPDLMITEVVENYNSSDSMSRFEEPLFLDTTIWGGFAAH